MKTLQDDRLPTSVILFNRSYDIFLGYIEQGNLNAAVDEFNIAVDLLNMTIRSYENLPLLEERYAYMKQKLYELKQ